MNEKIQTAWDAGLKVLKPSKRALEHGLELHRDSLVFESYGFMPTGAHDYEALAEAITGGASGLELQDLREEMSMTRGALIAAERAELVEAWHAAGVCGIFQNAGEEGSSPMRLVKRLARFTLATDVMKDYCVHAAWPDDVVRARAAGRRALYFSLNGVPIPQDWVSVEEELRYIRVFFQLGARMMHLTYNRGNMIGDGCAELRNAGLTDFGRTVVREMNEVGVIVDVAHSGWQTSLEAAKCSQRPIVASHSTCCAVHTHPRGKPDRVIRAIVDSGGYIGICCIPTFLGRSGDLNAFLDHLVHAVKKFGADHVAIGTDVAYQSRNAAGGWEKLPKLGPRRRGWESFWPPHVPVSDPRWLKPGQRESLAWTNWPLFTVGMVERGLKDADIRKILGENVLRVARAVLPANIVQAVSPSVAAVPAKPGARRRRANPA